MDTPDSTRSRSCKPPEEELAPELEQALRNHMNFVRFILSGCVRISLDKAHRHRFAPLQEPGCPSGSSEASIGNMSLTDQLAYRTHEATLAFNNMRNWIDSTIQKLDE